MQLKTFRSLWGFTGDRTLCAQELRAVGCCGVEARVPVTDADARQELARFLEQESLDYIAILFTGGDVIPFASWSVDDHLAYLEKGIQAALELNPVKINVLAGSDRWTLAERIDFFKRAQALAEKCPVPCLFETHRGSALYAPWQTLEIIEVVAGMQLTLDLSHWVVVSERLLDEASDWQALQPVYDRVAHIQTRVGHAQAPQVMHPAAPEAQAALKFHEKVWHTIWLRQLQQGDAVTTVTPEYGPDNYTPHLPFTDMPIADLWSLNAWMAQHTQADFAQFIKEQQ